MVTEDQKGADVAASGMPELSDGGFEMLQVAVRLARDKQIRTVASLRERLRAMFGSERSADIDQAIRYWAAQLAVVGVFD